MIRVTPLVALLTACSCFHNYAVRHESDDDTCITVCGLVAPAGTCHELNEVTKALVEETAKEVLQYEDFKIDPRDVCYSMIGWRVKFYTPSTLDSIIDEFLCYGGWYSFANNECVIGTANTYSRTITVSNGDWLNPHTGAIVHELFHVYDFETGEGIGHCGWGSRHIKEIISKVTNSLDTSTEEDFCEETFNRETSVERDGGG